MIDRLTQEHLTRISEFVNKWTEIGLSTKPVDRQRVEDHIKTENRDAGRPEPAHFAWFDSPLVGAIAYLAVFELGKLDGSDCKIYGQSLDFKGASVRATSLGGLKASVNQGVLSLLARDMADNVSAQVYDFVDAVIRNVVLDCLPGALVTDVWESTTGALGGKVKEETWATVRQRLLSDLASLTTTVFRQGLGKESPIDLRCLSDYLSTVCGLDQAG